MALCEIEDINKLHNITRVKKLCIFKQHCTEKIILHFNNLEELDCCGLSRLTYIKCPEKIKKLSINPGYSEGLEITNTNGLENFINLESLNLGNNKITKMENFNKLEFLDLSYNLIEKIENLDTLENLEKLTLQLDIKEIEENEKLNEIQTIFEKLLN